MQSGDFHINVDAIKVQTDSIDLGDQQQVPQEKQASTRQYDQTNKLTSFNDLCQVTDAQLLGKLNAHNDEEHANYLKWATIQRVPEVLKRNDDFKEYYKPMELSVGPLHAADPNLFKAELKTKLAAKFVKESGHTAEDLFEEIKKNLLYLKTSFEDEEIKPYTDEIFARLLFLDGCAVLQFIHSYVNQSLNEFSINNGQADLIRQDFFLLENQIPFKVLQLLMDMKAQKSLTTENKKDSLKDSLVQFLLANSLMELEGNIRYNAFLELSSLIDAHYEMNAVHLLALLRSLLITYSHCNRSHFCLDLFWVCVYTFCTWLIYIPFSVLSAFSHFVSCIISCFGDNSYQQQSFRNVQELTAVGITLKPITNSCTLRDISFRKRWFFRGHVVLPQLLVDGSTARKMLNLVAYEMCSFDYQEDCYVTSYINLIDLLVDDEEDVKLLRSADVLRNRLSTDTEVATLLNKIGSTCLSPPKDKYLDVKSNIQNHYKQKLAVWMAQVYHVHFSSPWTILALLAAATVLFLTAIQTWYAIHPKN